MDRTTQKKNPSRQACEATIKRILMTEVLQNGSNQHFRFASDFMNYFESLYIPSPGLTKQVQRAVKALNMPKDENGFFIVNKTNGQLEQDKEIKRIFSNQGVTFSTLEDAEPLFLQVDDSAKDYLYHLLLSSETFQGKYVTMFLASGGIMIYTQNKNQLVMLLNSLTI